MRGVIFLDCETGGLEPHHPVIEFAAVAVKDWQEVTEIGGRPIHPFQRRLRFDPDQCDAEALELNGYSADLWADAVDPIEAIRDFINWLNPFRNIEKVSQRTGRPYTVAGVAGHNPRFDVERINALSKAANEFMPAAMYEALDTCALARWVDFYIPLDVPNFQLQTLLERFEIAPEGPAHTSLPDARGSWMLAQQLTTILRGMG